jgi:septum formation protein
LILAADTIVVLGDQILGKPDSAAQAHDFLRQLSAKTHQVMTGMTLLKSGSSESWSGVDTTAVGFRKLSEAEILEYVASGEPMDKAGAYGIQGAAKKFVSSISGSWSNVVGLPLERLEKVLSEKGWPIDRSKP